MASGEIAVWFRAIEGTPDSDNFIRTLLSHYTGLSPAAVVIARGEHGKPYLANAEQGAQFSISHSGDWMVCAIAMGVSLGVDIELHDQRREVMPLAHRFFSEGEYRHLLAMDADAGRRRFYDLWTLREARVKALGSTLGKELESADFQLEDTGSLPLIRPQPGDPDDFYGLYSVFADYSFALCALSSQTHPPRVTMFELLPGGEIRTMPVNPLASSHF